MFQFLIRRNPECLKDSSGWMLPRVCFGPAGNCRFNGFNQLIGCANRSPLGPTNNLCRNCVAEFLFAKLLQHVGDLFLIGSLQQLPSRHAFRGIKPHVQLAAGLETKASLFVRQLVG